MIKVITYGTYDQFHYGHERLLKRAKALGDYLIVGVTTDEYDKRRGKINVKQSLMERVAAVRESGIADEIIIKEYEGQKVNDIKKYDIDIFATGSDWTGNFDYVEKYCKMVYLDRTEGFSSTQIRTEVRNLNVGLVGEWNILNKIWKDGNSINGINIIGYFSEEGIDDSECEVFPNYDELLNKTDAVFITSTDDHYNQVKKALNLGKHVLCQSPIAFNSEECKELFELAESKDLILMEANKTAYLLGFTRLLLLAEIGRVGKILSVDLTCNTLKEIDENDKIANFSKESVIESLSKGLLPILQSLGVDYNEVNISKNKTSINVNLNYENANANLNLVSDLIYDSELTLTGTNGYIYVPSPWWETDFFELRFKDSKNNKKYFYQIIGEGFRNELLAFVKTVKQEKIDNRIEKETSKAISDVVEKLLE